MSSAYFPICIRGENYLVIQKGNVIEIVYEDGDDIDVPEGEIEVVMMYLVEEGFIK
jgi:hypothetical protein